MSRSRYTRNTALDAELRRLTDEGVLAGAVVVQRALKDRFAERGGGYLHGKWATGYAADIQVGPLYTRRGVRRADVYTEAHRDGEDGPAFYPAFWEFGHYNIFTGEDERVPTFAPVMMEQIGAVEGAMLLAIRAYRGAYTRKTGAISVGVNLREMGL